MNDLDRNKAIKDYIQNLFVLEEESFVFARQNSAALGLPSINVPSNVGKILYLLTKLKSPLRVLEIGTLGGYSTLWLAKGLPKDGRLISLELESFHKSVAEKHLENAGYQDQVEIRLGVATELLSEMITKGEKPFDLIFIDADKESYEKYLELSLKLSKSGTLILTDNLIPKGEPIDNPHPNNGIANAIYAYNRYLAKHPQLESVPLTTLVGELGRIDALGLSIVK